LKSEELIIIDRKFSFFKVKGYKVSPSYIEKIILDSKMIIDVKVLAEDDKIIALVIPISNYKKDELISFLSNNLPYNYLPDLINEVTFLSRTLTGKIIRK